jgi:16S rRNA (cytosine967-C5)-methyltransferase
MDVAWGRDMNPGRQVLTGEAGMDGFYYACLVKSGE